MKKYDVRKDNKLKLLLLKELMNGYNPYLTYDQLQNIYDIIVEMYDRDISSVEDYINGIYYKERIFLKSKYHSEHYSCNYSTNRPLFVIECNGKKYCIESDSEGNVLLPEKEPYFHAILNYGGKPNTEVYGLSLEKLKEILPTVYEYIKTLGHQNISLETLSYLLAGTDADYSDIVDAVNNNKGDFRIKNYIVNKAVDDLGRKESDVSRINNYINELSKSLRMFIMPFVEKNTKRLKKNKRTTVR